MLDVNEISKQIVIEKPAVLSLLGEGMVASHARRKLESEYDRALLEFLSLYANRLRRWMEQSINALRNRFAVFADMYRVHLEGTPVSAFAEMSAVQTHLQILRDWQLLIRSLSLAAPECRSEFSIRVGFRARTQLTRRDLQDGAKAIGNCL
jgi:hypothetical protein